MAKMTKKEFLNILKNNFINDTVDISKIDYISMSKYIKINCSKHGEYSIRPYYLLKRRFLCVGCKKEYKNKEDIQNNIGIMISKTKKIIDLDSYLSSGAKVWKVQCQNCKNITFGTMTEIKKHLVCGNCKERPKGETGLLQHYNTYVDKAKRRNIQFNLSLEEFKAITSQNCHYCNDEPKPIKYITTEWSQYFGIGIDRMNNNQGYILSNCLPCCSTCNKAKLTMSYQKFTDYLKRLIEFHKQRQKQS